MLIFLALLCSERRRCLTLMTERLKQSTRSVKVFLNKTVLRFGDFGILVETETSSSCCFYRATAKHTHGFPIDVCPSVRLSVRPSVKRVYCDKTKAPSEKSSIMTNRKSPTSFPMSLRLTSYVAPNPPKGASKTKIC